jgi:hypothetical protein
MAQTHFFATREDILLTLSSVERGDPPIIYASGGMLSASQPRTYDRAADIPGLGMADSSAGNACLSFLVLERGTTILVRPVGLSTGATRYCVDQLLNPDTVVLTPAGSWGDTHVLRGRVSTVSGSVPATVLMRRFRAALRRTFTAIRGVYVGPASLSLLDAGKRLAISIQTPTELDLRR